jgi:two-component system cell cycle response regulator
MDAMKQTSQINQITQADVEQWIGEHPEFLESHGLRAPVNIMTLDMQRERWQQQQNRQSTVEEMLSCVQRNETIYRLFHQVQLRLLDTCTPETTVLVLIEAMESTLAIDRVTVTLVMPGSGPALANTISFSQFAEALPESLVDRVFLHPGDRIVELVGTPPVVAVRVGREGRNRVDVFGSHANHIRSDAIIPLVDHGRDVLVGTLNLGGIQPTRFLPSYSTDLVQDLADVFTLCLKRHFV